MWNGIGIGIGRTSFPGFSGLLDSFSGAAAAYSLRQLKSGVTNAIEVRRSADDTTQDIGFVGGQLDTASLEEFVNCEDVAPADYGSGAAAAYSLRYVSASYTGDVIQVRRSSDDTTQDFNPTEITDGTLATFCGAGDGFVTTWYDQSGNSNDAEQTTASQQPQIVSSGSVILENGKPALEFDGSDDYLSNASSLSYNGGVSWYGVQNLVLNGERLWSDDITGTQGYVIFKTSTDDYQFNDNGNGFANFTPSGWLAQQQLASLNFDDSNGNYNYAFDGSNTSGTISGWSGPLGTSGSSNLGIMSAGNGAQYGEGKLQELIIYPNDQSSNRPKIEANINNYYSIYTNTNNGYVTTWYDQSGNSNDAEQTTAANQPQIVSSGSVITENGNPTIDFDGSDDTMVATYTLGTDLTSVLVLKSDINTSTADSAIYQYNIDNDNHYAHGFRNGGLFTRIYKNAVTNEENGYDFSSTSQFLSFNIYDYANTTNTLYVDNILGTDNNSGRSQQTSGSFIQIMARGNGAFPTDGKLTEMIFYPSDQSSNRSGIETNINAQYQIYWDGSQTSLLDTYSGSAAAYSLRALNSVYTGALIKVRRASDNAEQDIYDKYDGSLNVDALESFCSGTNGFVTTWYDQSGNGYDATQSTAASQPQIVSSGSVITENGKPSVEFDGINDNFIQSNINILNDKIGGSMFVINKCDTTIVSGESVVDVSFTGGSSTRLWIAQGRTTALRYETGGRRLSTDTFSEITSDTNISTQGLISSICNYQNQDLFLYQNATKVAENLNFQSSGNSESVNSDMAIGSSTGNSRYWDGNIQEIVIYDTDQSSNRTGIETNINDFYNIY